MRYSLSYDDGKTWQGDYAMPQIPCGWNSFTIEEDPYAEETTYYMATFYNIPSTKHLGLPRLRVALLKSNDGFNWEYLCDVDRWGDVSDTDKGHIMQGCNMYVTVTEDYVFVSFSRSEEFKAGNNHRKQVGRLYRFEKDKMVAYDAWPQEYIIPDKTITSIEGKQEQLLLNSPYEENTFTVHYYNAESEEIAVKNAFVSGLDTSVPGEQTVILDYKDFRTIFTVNVVAGDEPVISGVVDGKTYCGPQTVTVTDANGDLNSVTLNGTPVSLVDGEFTVSATVGEQTIVATDKAGNSTTFVITVNDGHTGGTATCENKAECAACGTVYGELAAHKGGTATCTEKAKCSVCAEAYGELDADNHSGEAKWTITADKHSKTYECCDAVVVAEGNHTGGTATCEDKAVCSVCSAEYGTLAAHKGGTASCTEKAKCSVCAEAYGELDADNHSGEAKWTITADKHSKAYECCGKVVVAEAAHKLTDGKCECGYEAPKPVEPGEIENTTDADKNACGGTLDVKDEHLEDKLLTEEEKKEVQAGADINIYLTVEDISDKVSAEDKAAVEKNLNGMKVGLYLDINLEKQVGNKTPVKITQTNGGVMITITVPKELRNTESKYIRTYKVIRVHEGKVDILDATYDAQTNKLSFETDKFSTYTLVYSDAPSSDNSNTGDSALIVLYGGLLALSALAAGALLIPDIRKKLLNK